MKLLLARHGETPWNVEGRSQGHSDIPLNERGLSQAKRLAERLSDIDLAAVYCSDLGRAVSTATAVTHGRAGLEPTTDSRLRELGLGTWEGLHTSEIEERHQEERREWLESPASFRPPGGETLPEVQERMIAAMDDIAAAQAPEDIVLVVGHGYALIAWICHVLALDLGRFRHIWLDPAGLSEIIRLQERWIVRCLNDTSHLSP